MNSTSLNRLFVAVIAIALRQNSLVKWKRTSLKFS